MPPIYSITYAIPHILFYLLIAIPCFNVEVETLEVKRSYKYFRLISMLLIPFIFIGLRGFVFTDWYSYYPLFQSTPTLFDSKELINKFLDAYTLEPGFLIYNIIIKSIFRDYFFYQLVNFLIDYIIIIYFFKKYLKDYWYLGIYFFFLYNGNLIEINLFRNSKAMMLFLLSVPYIKQKKFLKYFLLNLLGITFHISSIIYIPLYFIVDRRFNRNFVFLMYIVGNIFYILNIQWISPLLDILFPILSINPRLAVILKQYMKASGAYSLSIGYIERNISFLLAYHFAPKLEKIDDENRIFNNFFYMYIFLFLYGSCFSIVYERVALLFIFSYWILFPRIYQILSPRYKSYFLVVFIMYGLIKYTNGNRNILSMYKFFFSEDFDEKKNLFLYARKGIFGN